MTKTDLSTEALQRHQVLTELQRLQAENARLEREADWLAAAAANNGWEGRRVSPEDMREAARKACGHYGG